MKKSSIVATPAENALWERIRENAGNVFVTSKGLAFTYTIRGSEMFVSRKEKSITFATVVVAYRRALELIDAGENVDGPKKLGTFGASYIFPIFKSLGILP